MAGWVALIAALVGAMAGTLSTYLTLRPKLTLELEYAYDRTLRDKRIDAYQRLFYVTRHFPRFYLEDERPTGSDLRQCRQELHDWYFNRDAGGMFLTAAAKRSFLELQNHIAGLAFVDGRPRDDGGDQISPEEGDQLIALGRRLRHQLVADIGSANTARISGTRPGPPLDPPRSILRARQD
ncbi:hypothetical protein BJ973_009417 [Actinoplanes tereljensis]|uniref:Uncharacterized protein n=1 Tax=Paractinoplanes tereljensis TaxID=571912 RepID=A0A919NFQ2_9ACTN|nr:hypothetical protein [Actinoplanes tereljensis]GIF17618.1 hypothetical protein Ate02nite_03480 [Actinoplanes tereljensis]